MTETTATLPLDGFDDDAGSDGNIHSTGILPSQILRRLLKTGEIFAVGDRAVGEDQIQPASVDLRLGRTAYRVRGSFLPGTDETVAGRLKAFTMHEIDITGGAVLERGCVYVVPLLEGLKLPEMTSAMANPKSSTGRLDIFTRVITDYSSEFDRIEEGYRGRLYAEISPLTFSVLVRTGTRLSQLRLRRGKPPASMAAMRRLHEASPLVSADDADIATSGVVFTVDITGAAEGGVIGYKAKRHTGVIDLEKDGYYEVHDFWDPIVSRGATNITLDPDEFYILASKEAVSVPPDHAAEMRAFDSHVGEFRVHYAGFFDPGFGHDAAGGQGSRAVLEVRPRDVPFVLEDGQTMGRLVYERLTQTTDQLYGSGIGSNYQSQGLKLSKHFKPPS